MSVWPRPLHKFYGLQCCHYEQILNSKNSRACGFQLTSKLAHVPNMNYEIATAVDEMVSIFVTASPLCELPRP